MKTGPWSNSRDQLNINQLVSAAWFVIIFQELNFLHSSINTIVTRKLDITDTHKENGCCYCQYCMHLAPCKNCYKRILRPMQRFDERRLWLHCICCHMTARSRQRAHKHNPRSNLFGSFIVDTTHILASAKMADCICLRSRPGSPNVVCAFIS